MIISCGEALIDCFQKEDSHSFDAIIGGSPLNVAIALANAGSDSALLTNISRDKFGEMHMKHIQQHNVSTKFITRSDHLSGLMFVQYNNDKSASYNFYGHNSAEINYRYSVEKPLAFENVECLHFGSFSLISGETSHSFSQIISKEKQQRVISIDINVRTAIEPDVEIWLNKFNELMSCAHILKASSEDICLLYKMTEFNQSTAQNIMRTWLSKGVTLAVITDADNGAYAMINDKLIHVPAKPVSIIDTVGAGDCFMAFLLNYLEKQRHLTINSLSNVCEAEIQEAMSTAIAAASFTVEKKGAIFPKTIDLNH